MGEDSRWRCENNPGLELALCPRKGESELHFQTDLVAHRTWKFPSEEETRDARQNLCLAKLAAGVAEAGPTQCSPQGALVRVPR